MIQDPVIARLKAALPPGTAKTIDGALNLAAAKTPPQTPALFVVPLTESAQPNQRATGGTLQRVVSHFGVYVVLRKHGDARGTRKALDLEDVRAAVRQALVGWPPGAEFDPVELTGGDLVEVDNGILWWLETYATAYSLET